MDRDRFLDGILLFTLIGVFVASCSVFNMKMGLIDDNALEELAEEVIRAETGVDIDLSPRSPENKEE